MRSFACQWVVLCISANALAATETPNLSRSEQEVLKIHKAQIDADQRGDARDWSRCVADGYIFNDDNGVPHTKANVLAQWGKEHKSAIHVTGG
jgi:hypothetical protein